jgi:hypothetical protein
VTSFFPLEQCAGYKACNALSEAGFHTKSPVSNPMFKGRHLIRFLFAQVLQGLPDWQSLQSFAKLKLLGASMRGSPPQVRSDLATNSIVFSRKRSQPAFDLLKTRSVLVHVEEASQMQRSSTPVGQSEDCGLM